MDAKSYFIKNIRKRLNRKSRIYNVPKLYINIYSIRNDLWLMNSRDSGIFSARNQSILRPTVYLGQQFLKNLRLFDALNSCEPIFMHRNILNLTFTEKFPQPNVEHINRASSVLWIFVFGKLLAHFGECTFNCTSKALLTWGTITLLSDNPVI